MTALSILLLVVCVLQVITIVLLLRYRFRNHKVRDTLQSSNLELEDKIQERTGKLRKLNSQLFAEIAHHEATEELLRQAQDYLHSILNGMPSILIGLSDKGAITHWNTAAAQGTGINASFAMGKPWQEVAHSLPIDPHMIVKTRESGQPQKRENCRTGQMPNAKYYDIAVYPLASNQPDGLVIRIDEVTARVQLETMMVQNDKMMSLGELAAGVAHELNNPLGAIIQSAQIIRNRLSNTDKNQRQAELSGTTLTSIVKYMSQREITRLFHNIQDASQRAAAIVENMLEFSRTSNQEHQQEDIKKLIDQSCDLASHVLQTPGHPVQNKIELQFDLDQEFSTVECNGAEIQQVIINLIRNAAQAIKEDANYLSKSPSISIKTKSNQSDLMIVIEDNGPGIPPEIRPHIFEPFYTTKTVGKGTGLGLSICYFIITERHDGTIEVESPAEGGTRFILHIPLSNDGQKSASLDANLSA